MYSVVMMMALSGGAEVPDFGWRRCCGGCCGCCGGVAVHHWGWRHGCCGCCGGCYGCACTGCVGCVGMTPVMPSADVMAFVPDESTFYPRPGPFLAAKDDVDVQNVKFQATEARPAVIVVTVPADTKVTFNGWTSTSTSTTRRFKTPVLEPGKEYAYMLRAELVRDGRTLVQTHQVVVRAGQETEVPIRFAKITQTALEE